MAITTHTYKYGTATVTGYEGAWRLEVYTPKDGSRPERERVMVTNHSDDTPRRNMSSYGEGAGYDRKCSCCWLGISHSERKHTACIGEK